MATANEVVYLNSDGYECKTKTAAVAYVRQQIRKGNKLHFFFIKGCATSKMHKARARALAKALHDKRVSAVLHGGWNIIVEPDISLRECKVLYRLSAKQKP
jgi:hypothetical protein